MRISQTEPHTILRRAPLTEGARLSTLPRKIGDFRSEIRGIARARYIQRSSRSPQADLASGPPGRHREFCRCRGRRSRTASAGSTARPGTVRERQGAGGARRAPQGSPAWRNRPSLPRAACLVGKPLGQRMGTSGVAQLAELAQLAQLAQLVELVSVGRGRSSSPP